MLPKHIAVIGAGEHSSLHHGSALRSYAALHPGEIELTAVCDLDISRAESYATRFGFVRTYSDFRTMIERERLDGIIAVTPAASTAVIVQELLDFGIPLVIEKPPGETSAQTRLLLEAARRKGTPHMVSFNRRFIPAVALAREWIAEGGAARSPRLAVARMLRHARREPGFVVATGVHLVDAVLSFMGPPLRVVASRAPVGPQGVYLNNASFTFSAGRSAALVIAPDVGVTEETLELLGAGFAMQIDCTRCRVRICEEGREVLSWQPPSGAAAEYVCGALNETATFLAALREAGKFEPDLGESLVSMLAAEAVEAGGESNF